MSRVIDRDRESDHPDCAAFSSAASRIFHESLYVLSASAKRAQWLVRHAFCLHRLAVPSQAGSHQALELGKERIISELDDLLLGLTWSSDCECRDRIVRVANAKDPAICKYFDLCIVCVACLEQISQEAIDQQLYVQSTFSRRCADAYRVE